MFTSGGAEELAIETLSDLVFHIRDRSAGRAALLSIDRGGRRETVSTSEFLSGIHSLALAMRARGVKKGMRVALLSENRPEWHMVDLACHLLGAVTVPIYPTLTPDQIGFILRNSGSSWIFYSDVAKRDKLLKVKAALTRSLELVALDHDAQAEEGLALVPLLGEGAAESSTHHLDRLRGSVSPDDPASIIYTSGTTGDPKGVVLTHANFTSNILACDQVFELQPTDIALAFLPLSHVFERTVDYLFFYRSLAIHYSPSVEKVAQLLPTVRPTVLSSVPRVYERAYLKITQQVAKETPMRRRLFAWALRVGQRYATARLDRFVGPWLALQRFVAMRLVYRKIHERFGGRLRFAIAGGAPLGTEIATFFEAVGVNLFQGYGMTEAAPVISANNFRFNRLASVGKPLPGVEVKIAEDGEILVKSPGVMEGYWENPEATAEAVDKEGWLHTGDVGEIDKDGFLFITDRKKDLLVTSGGKNVAPQPIENLLTAHWSIAQALVAGDNYPYLTALIVPRFEELPQSLQKTDDSDIAQNVELRRIIGKAVTEVNERLADHERIRKWALLPEELTEAAGEVTPTLKIRRNIVLERHADLVDSLYLKTQRSSQGSMKAVGG